MSTQRKVDPYDPMTHLRSDWSEWRLCVTDLDGVTELICWQRQRIYLDRWKFNADPQKVLAHALAHLDWHKDGPDDGAFTAAEEAEAEWLAELRLDRAAAA